jgi:hypothetical protein
MQHWGVCYGGKIVAVYKDYDRALEEAMAWTMETGAQHVVMAVRRKENEN